MTETLPRHLTTRRTGSAGIGLFTKEPFAAAKEIWGLKKPWAAALDSQHLQDTCSNCFLWLPDQGESESESRGQSESSLDQTSQIDRIQASLKQCLGCKVVRYCCKACQTESWKAGHKYECSKIFAKLYPKVLPNTVRLVIRLLLLHNNRSLSTQDWNTFLQLQSHIEDFKREQITNEEGLTTWQTIELMAQATATYSGTREPIQNIQAMVARVMINAHTLTTATLDPLGLYLSPISALLNHSCDPNVYLVFAGPSLTLRSSTQIAAETELTISYIDTTNSTLMRQSELQSRYFFTCTCVACIGKKTNGQPDPPLDSSFAKSASRALELQKQAAKSTPIDATAAIKEALKMLEQFSLHQQPYPSILHNGFLNSLATRSWYLALRYALRAYFHIDPIHYPISWHPVRIVRKWILLRLVVQIAGLGGEKDETWKFLDDLGIDWRVVAEGLWKETSAGVVMSHGEDSPFAGEVMVFKEMIVVGGDSLGPEMIEEQWRKLKIVANEPNLSLIKG